MDDHAAEQNPDPVPEGADFSSFIMSLATSALMHLGEVMPEDSAPHIDLPLAKHTIDIIGMLQEKTKGNLTPEESKGVEDVLYDLRIRFLEVRKRHK